ncbi:uncharacterized protein I303_101845 [Kwoniella dejecticola CBS 10117]|uniref:Uncharacterized protein n=1 Tax=Kwoniella dejecticola CBS 10117 TaxID=1296121 RepID=A0A1A6ACM3_9TREE|nr:uncharacterized protein I303_02019 [Kwoniella dejecticola CBS 10117]OBR87806.1 hypothetical protein I303_02019 [Kwoniella dejecticola CBS 10117]
MSSQSPSGPASPSRHTSSGDKKSYTVHKLRTLECPLSLIFPHIPKDIDNTEWTSRQLRQQVNLVSYGPLSPTVPPDEAQVSPGADCKGDEIHDSVKHDQENSTILANEDLKIILQTGIMTTSPCGVRSKIAMLIIPSTIVLSPPSATRDNERMIEIHPYPLKGSSRLFSTMAADRLEDPTKTETFSVNFESGLNDHLLDQALFDSTPFQEATRDETMRACKLIVFKKKGGSPFKNMIRRKIVQSPNQDLKGQEKDADEDEIVKVGKVIVGYRFFGNIDD